jgi:hypothetical protein
MKKKDIILRCPLCGSDDLSEITGWCMNHSCPIIHNDRIYCNKPEDCEVIFNIDNAWHCNNCQCLFDSKKNCDWTKENPVICPVGKVTSDDEPEDAVDDFLSTLLDRISDYDESKIKICMDSEYYYEVIISLHRRVFEQLRFIIIHNILFDENSNAGIIKSEANRLTNFLKSVGDAHLYGFSFFLGVFG